jgi:phospholipid-binding lipoprotein MlaA
MKIYRFKRRFVSGCLVAVLTLSTASGEEEYLSYDDLYNEEVEEPVRVDDPLEALNRFTFGLNDLIYNYVLTPISNTYTAITPDPIERGATNFFTNLNTPVRLAGNLLQGRLQGAWVETGRFAINTTVGILGIMSPADHVDGFQALPPEDIGQAFGAWGVSEGPYLVLPFLGPSNLRDLGGLVGDRAVHPLKEPFSLIDDWDWEWRTGLAFADFLQSSPLILERYRQLKGSSIDPYSAVKNGYTQFRRAAIKR